MHKRVLETKLATIRVAEAPPRAAHRRTSYRAVRRQAGGLGATLRPGHPGSLRCVTTALPDPPRALTQPSPPDAPPPLHISVLSASCVCVNGLRERGTRTWHACECVVDPRVCVSRA
eukprot:2531883-Prymnesium_polylepis.1